MGVVGQDGVLIKKIACLLLSIYHIADFLNQNNEILRFICRLRYADFVKYFIITELFLHILIHVFL